jgi:hypothetical protein
MLSKKIFKLANKIIKLKKHPHSNFVEKNQYVIGNYALVIQDSFVEDLDKINSPIKAGLYSVITNISFVDFPFVSVKITPTKSTLIYQVFGIRSKDNFFVDDICKRTSDWDMFDSYFREEIESEEGQKLLEEFDSLLEKIQKCKIKE